MKPPIISDRYDLVVSLAESLVSRCQSIIDRLLLQWIWIDGSELLLSKYPAAQKLRAKGQDIRQARVIANYQTVPENWVLIQRKIGYPASPSKTNLESGVSYSSVMIELMLLESVIINQIWWEWINTQLLDVIQTLWAVCMWEGRKGVECWSPLSNGRWTYVSHSTMVWLRARWYVNVRHLPELLNLAWRKSLMGKSVPRCCLCFNKHMLVVKHT